MERVSNDEVSNKIGTARNFQRVNRKRAAVIFEKYNEERRLWDVDIHKAYWKEVVKGRNRQWPTWLVSANGSQMICDWEKAIKNEVRKSYNLPRLERMTEEKKNYLVSFSENKVTINVFSNFRFLLCILTDFNNNSSASPDFKFSQSFY